MPFNWMKENRNSHYRAIKRVGQAVTTRSQHKVRLNQLSTALHTTGPQCSRRFEMMSLPWLETALACLWYGRYVIIKPLFAMA